MQTGLRSLLRWLIRFIKKPAFLAFVSFGILTCVMTYPLIFHMNYLIGGGGGDGTYYVWLIRWYQRALFQLHQSPFFAPYLNYPQGWYLVTIDITPAMVAIAMPAALLFGPVVGYNFSMLMSFVLAGWGMFLWIRHLTGDARAGMIAGMIFAFFPYHMAHVIIGHLNVAGIQWFPFYFWGLFDLLKQERFSWKPIILASVSAVLISLTSPYYMYMTVLLSAVFLFGFIIFRGWKNLQRKVFWKSLLAFGAIAGITVSISFLPYLAPNARSGIASFPVETASTYSASPTDFVMPSVWQFLWGGWFDKHFYYPSPQEATLYIGFVTFILAGIVLARWRKLPQAHLAAISVLVALTGFVLALGIDPHWLGQKVTVLPPFLASIFHHTNLPEIHLPAYYLFRYLPFFSRMRVMMRFGVFTLVFASVLAGLGAYVLLKRFSGKLQNWLTVLVLLLVFIDYYPGVFKDLAPIGVSPVYLWLADQPGTGAVAIFPFSEDSGQQAVYDTLIYNKPFIGGHFNASHPEQYMRILPVMEDFPSADSIDELRQLGVTYVIVDSTQYPNFSTTDGTIRSLGLEFLHNVGTDYVYWLP